jgi:hypothetical protein
VLITRILKEFLKVRDFCDINTSLYNCEHRENVLKCLAGYSFDGNNSPKDIPLGDIPLGDDFFAMGSATKCIS